MRRVRAVVAVGAAVSAILWMKCYRTTTPTPITTSTVQRVFPPESSLSSHSNSRHYYDYYDSSCRPRGLHWSQGSNVEYGRVSMTLSFFVRHNKKEDSTNDEDDTFDATSNYPDCSAVTARYTVMGGKRRQYPPQRGAWEVFSVQAPPPLQFFTTPLENDDDDDMDDQTATPANANSSQTGTRLQKTTPSDWIYHVPIPDLVAGSVEYWYRIRVDFVHPLTNASSSTTTNATTTSSSTSSSSASGSSSFSYRDRTRGVNPNNGSLRRRRPTEMPPAATTTTFSANTSTSSSGSRSRSGDEEEQRTLMHSFPVQDALDAAQLASASSHSTRSATTPRYRFRTPPQTGPTAIAFCGDVGQSDNSMRTLLDRVRRATRHLPHYYSEEEDDDDAGSSASFVFVDYDEEKEEEDVYNWLERENDNTNDDGNDFADFPIPPVSMVVLGGDISYANGDPNLWSSWLYRFEPLFRSTPLAVAAGNHEIECDPRTRTIFAAYESYFRSPNRIADASTTPLMEQYVNESLHGWCTSPSQFQGDYQYGNSYYGFRHGLVHIIVLNSYTNCTPGSAQYEWLTGVELARNVDRSITPWLLVVFHAPFYTTFIGHPHLADSDNRQAVEPVLVQFGVNLVLAGHDHAYLRTHPVYDSKMDYSATSLSYPVHVTVGTGGCDEGTPVHGYQQKLFAEPWVAVRRLSDSGYGHFTAINATHAIWDFRANAVTTDYTEIANLGPIQQHVRHFFQGRDKLSDNDKRNRHHTGQNGGHEPFRDRVWLHNPKLP